MQHQSLRSSSRWSTPIDRDRLTTGLRILVAIPILIVLGAVSGAGGWESSADDAQNAAAAAGGLLFCGPLLLILFRQVPAVVVRLEPGAAALRQPGGRLPGVDGRPLPRPPTNTSRSTSTTPTRTPSAT